jgi:peroxiredoxin
LWSENGHNGAKGENMAHVPLNAPAPDFELTDFRGEPFRLAGMREQKNVLLVFNRGFM